MKIVVLAGGLSPERNVSLSSGCKVCAALRERGHETALIDMYLGTGEEPAALFAAPIPEELTRIGRQAPDLESVKASRTEGGASQFGPGVLDLCGMADVVFLGLHGACGEDGRVQAVFDLMGIPYTGSGHLASGMAMNKAVTKLFMERAGVLTAPWRELTYTREDIPRLTGELPLPCAVKTINGGSSLGMALPDTREELAGALEEINQTRQKLMEQLRVYLRQDPVPATLVDMTKLGLIEITRKKKKKPLAEQLCV